MPMPAMGPQLRRRLMLDWAAKGPKYDSNLSCSIEEKLNQVRH